MLGIGTTMPWPGVWGQVTPGGASANPSALAPLALRRWFGSLTLSSPESVPSHFGLWVWLAGLAGLLALAAVAQGPSRALGQAFDLAGHARLWGSAARRLRRAGRMVAVTVGMTVLSWTGSQSLTFSRAESRDDLIRLTRARGLGELAVEQGVMAGLTPLRDPAGLGSNLPLLVVVTLVLFRASSEVWGGEPVTSLTRRKRVSGWANVGWACGGLLILYRLVSLAGGSHDLPAGGCLLVEALVIPALMAVCDGLLLAWVLVELREAGFDGPGAEGFDTLGPSRLLPAATLACLCVLPARYLATAVLLALDNLPTSALNSPAGAWMRWQLSWGLADVQGAALLTAGLAGAVAWSGGGMGSAVSGYARMLRAEGGRVFAVIAAAGLASAAVSSVAYFAVLSLPAASWVLNAADSYAHYGTVPVGLAALAALVELGERSLPEAALVPVSPSPALAETAGQAV